MAFGQSTFQKRQGLAVLVWALCFNLLIGTGFLLWIPPAYETRDDITMMRIVSGDLSGAPEARAVFLHPVIGAMLATLYRLTQRVDWYALHLLIAHAVSMSCILVVFWRNGATLFRTGLFILFFCFYQARFLISLQFTTTAFVLGFAGMLLLAAAPGQISPYRHFPTASGILLIGWSSMIRLDACVLAMLFGLPLVLWRVWRKRSRLVPFYLVLGVLLVALVSVGGEVIYNLDSDWAVFRRYVANHGKMFLDRFSVHVAAVAEAAGWSRNDITMFQQFFYPCPDTYYSVETTSRIIEMAQGLERGDVSWLRRWIRVLADRWTWKHVMDGYRREGQPMLAASFAFAVMGFLRPGRRKEYGMMIACTLGIMLAVAVYLVETARFPHRVSLCFPFALSALSLFYLTSVRSDSVPEATWRTQPCLGRAGGVLRVTATVGLVALVLWQGQWLHRLNKRNQDSHRRHRAVCDVFRCVSSDGNLPLVVSFPADFPAPETGPFWSSDIWNVMRLIPSSWVTHSPVYEACLKRFGVQDVFLHLLEDPNALLIASPWRAELVRTFLVEHYDRESILIPISPTDLCQRPRNGVSLDFSIYKLQPADKQPES